MILLTTVKLIVNLIIIYSHIIMIDKGFNTIFIPHKIYISYIFIDFTGQSINNNLI